MVNLETSKSAKYSIFEAKFLFNLLPKSLDPDQTAP